MGFSEFEIKRYQMILDDFMESKRPPVEIRDELDIAYRIENQSVVIFEIRPEFQNPSSKIEIEVAKTTYVRTKNKWKLFWMRRDLKWHSYEPDLFSDSIEEVLSVIDKDENGCFWG
ncbi:DUF3024 domain-containing protein [Spirochaeta lutea]|uniref:DUF3024 domain-containing protein n=1 Tax=Spirochaeta lutea TaxID=1480694 RepID=A0A098QXE1_9SPIO|nr:DUF3024 domain-containing protein [Spirochaeta lutea]KGE72108.1 hypothetical protein DC28_07770 [Spirochaeta lutea]